MSDTLFITEILFGVLVIYLAFALRWVKKPMRWVVELNIPFFPTYSFIWRPGIHVMWIPIPPIMYVREEIPVTTHQPFKMQVGSNQGLGNPDPVEFSDDSAGVDIQVTLMVENEEAALLATYKVQDTSDLIARQSAPTVDELQLRPYQRASLNHVESQLRALFGKEKLDDAIRKLDREAIQNGVKDTVGEIIKAWGVTLINVAIVDFRLSDETLGIRQKVLNAEKEAEVTRLESEAERDATVRLAEGKKRAAELEGEGERARVGALKELGLAANHSAAYHLARANVDAFGQAKTTIIATSEGGNVSQLATMAGLAKGLFGGGNEPPPPTPTPPKEPTPPAPDTPPTSNAPAPEATAAADDLVPDQKGFRTRRRQNRT